MTASRTSAASDKCKRYATVAVWPYPVAVNEFGRFVAHVVTVGLSSLGRAVSVRRRFLFAGLIEFQRDWTRHETYEAASSIVVETAVGTESVLPTHAK